MEISVPKQEVIVVSVVPAPAVDFTCNSNPVEQVATLSFRYLGLHFHRWWFLGGCIGERL